MKENMTSLCLPGVALLLASCVTTQSTPPTVAGCMTWDQQQASPMARSVAVLSPELARIIGVRDMSTSRTATGMAAVQTEVYNCSDVDVVLIMRTRFTGERGQSESPSAWRTVFLAPRGTTVYGESALSMATSRVAVDIADANRGQSQFAPGQSYVLPPPPPSSAPR